MSSVGLKHERIGRLPDAVAFWSVGGILTLFLVASAVPSPLYQIYSARWHFSSLTLTVVFGLYAIALLASLLVTGRLSDHLGRRPVILAAIAIEIASMVCFIAANSVDLLIAARILSGLGTGCAVGALSAYLTELADGRRTALAPVVASLSSNVGLAAGAAGASALIQYAPAPLRLVYWVLLGGLVISALLILVIRETGERRPGTLASLAPVVEVPEAARQTFFSAVPALTGLWALAGFYLSLGPGVLTGIVGSSNLLWGGSVIFACWTSATISGTGFKKASPQAASVFGCLGLLLGVALTFLAIATSTTWIFLLGCVVAGAGLGPTWLGSFRSVTTLAPPTERAGTVAAVYVVSYLAFSVPVIVAGVATTHFSVRDVALVYCAVVAVLEVLGALAAAPALRSWRANRA